MGIFNKKIKNKNKGENPIEKEKTALYILLDAPKLGLVQYMRENGIEVKGLYYDIIEANYAFMLEETNARIIVIDTGTGLFSKVANREEIISLLGMCEGNKKGIVFYTDTALKTAIFKTLPKIKLVSYISTLGIVKALREFNEEYCYGGAEDEVVEEMLQFKGTEVPSDMPELMIPLSSLDVTNGFIGSKEDTVVTFNVKY